MAGDDWLTVDRFKGIDDLRVVVEWLLGHICQPHDDLGRLGPVCPFTGPAIRSDHLWLTTYEDVGGVEGACEVVEKERLRFLEVTKGTQDPACALVMLFLANDGADQRQLVLDAQRAMKPRFVANGLMLGEFAPGYKAAGVRNPQFRPLVSPVPLLVIRPMVRGDHVFLQECEEWLLEYYRRFGGGDDLDPAERMRRQRRSVTKRRVSGVAKMFGSPRRPRESSD